MALSSLGGLVQALSLSCSVCCAVQRWLQVNRAQLICRVCTWSLRAPASEERTQSTCVSCRSTRARLHRSSSFCEQNCFSDFTNNCNNLFFFRSLSHLTLLSMSLRRVSPAERALRPPCKSCVTVDIDPTVPWEYSLCLDFFSAFTNNDNDLFSFSSLSPSIATSCSIVLHREASGIAIARRANDVERRFLIEFSSIFMKILACMFAGHPVTFLAMLCIFFYFV